LAATLVYWVGRRASQPFPSGNVDQACGVATVRNGEGRGSAWWATHAHRARLQRCRRHSKKFRSDAQKV